MLRAMRPLCLSVVVLLSAACGGAAAVAAPDTGERTEATARPVAGPRADLPVVSTKDALSWGGVVAERCREVEPLLRAAAEEHGVDVALIAGVIRVESAFRPKVKSHAGAVGLMQVMPSNAERLGCGDLEDPEANIACGVEVLRRFLAYYDQELIYALSGYHAGFRMPNRARAKGELPANANYVERVLAARAGYLRHGCQP